MGRTAGHVKKTGTERHVTEARLWEVLRAATQLVDTSTMIGRSPGGGRSLFATQSGAMLALATKCDLLRDAMKRRDTYGDER
jgi:hypothetical protein